MSPPSPHSAILDAYKEHESVYAALGTRAQQLITELLKQQNLVVHSVTARSKEPDSLEQKLGRPDKRYTSLADITDLCGVRIITHFDDDVDKVANILANEFALDENHSIDKRKQLDPDRFGYQSLHFVASFSAQRCKLLEYRQFAELKMEIQIRSILQHAWAEIEHDLGYKSTIDVPRDLRRRFARVAGLLELADAEFTSIRQSLLEMGQRMEQEIVSHPEQVGLDLLTLKAAYASSLALRTLDRRVSEIAHARLHRDASFVLEHAVKRLAFLGIDSIAALEQQARQQLPLVEAFAREWMTGDSYTRLELGVGLTYLCYVLVGARQNRQFALDYLHATSTAGSKLQERLADNILGIYRKLTMN